MMKSRLPDAEQIIEVTAAELAGSFVLMLQLVARDFPL